jgi:hypothetical protein
MARRRALANLGVMEPQSNDQQQFDEQVNKSGKLVLEVLAGLGVFAALLMSIIALLQSTNSTNTTTVIRSAAAPAASKLPTSASATIVHTTVGCHTLDVAGTAGPTPHATLHLATGAVLHVQDNDVMPHRLISVTGPQPQFANPNMTHMGARSTVTFPAAGTYVLQTKAGEDYTTGIKTIGPDNTIRIKVVVGGAPA